MSELRQQMIDAVLVRGFSPRTHKSYLAAISKTIVIAGVSAHGIGPLLAVFDTISREAGGRVLSVSAS